MRKTTARVAAVALLGSLSLTPTGCGAARCGENAKCRPAEASSPKEDTRPPVVVALVVDQLAAWVAYDRLAELPAAGGFARLRNEGTWVREMHYMHSATDTAPGHSALFTGKAPVESGIFGNEVPGENGHVVSILRDESTQLVGVDGPLTKKGSSLARLRVPTVADDLRARAPDASIFAMSLKDRGALFGGGRKPDLTVFFDTGEDAFVTSTAFATELPAWVRPIVDKGALAADRAVPWSLADGAPWVQAHAATSDDAPGEGNLGGLGTVFPHTVPSAAAYRASPASDARLAAIAKAALGAIKTPSAPLFMEVSFSANDIIGHTFGPDSWEAWAELRALDATLASLFQELDRVFGADRWTAVLSGDHGTTMMPEASAAPHAPHKWCASGERKADRFDRPCKTARMLPREIAKYVDAAVTAAIGGGPWVEAVADPYLFDAKGAAALDEEQRARLHQMEKKILLATHRDTLADVWTIEELRARCTKPIATWDESMEALVCRAFSPSAIVPGADTRALYMIPAHGAFFDPAVVVGKGTSHGSPNLYDRTVPLLVRAPGRVGAGRLVDQPVRFDAYHDVLMSLLRLVPESPEAVLRRHAKPAAP